MDVTITGDTTSNMVEWLIDINSPAHPNVKLDAFYFNMAGAAGDYSFSAYSPTGWVVSAPGNNASGSSGADFMFVANDPPGLPNAADVTNSVSLSFKMTKATGNFLVTDFTTAPFASSSDQVLGSGQLGAHLQSLTLTPANGCGAEQRCSDSGFAFGNYKADNGGGGPGEVPEPGVLFLVGAGLMGMGLARKRR